MRRAAATVCLAYLWTLIASAVFCFFDFRLFRFPYLQWWEGLYYARNMLWLPRWHDIDRWPLFWFIDGFVFASVVILTIAQLMWPRRDRQPNLYGTSKFAGVKAMAAGGITTEKRT